MNQQHPSRVPDYTTANLILILVNLFWVFGVIWIQWGLGAVILLGVALDHGVTWLAAYRVRRAAQSIRRGKSGYEEA